MGMQVDMAHIGEKFSLQSTIMTEWLATPNEGLDLAVVVVPEEELTTMSETTICYEDFRSAMRFTRITKKLLVDLLFQKYLGKISKKALRQKTREDLLQEAGLLVK